MITTCQFYTEICHIKTPEVLEILVAQTKVLHLKKGELLVCAGESQPDVCFLIEGLLRGYFLDIKGNECTDCFGYRCGTASMAFSQLGTENISPMNIEMLEDSVFFCVPISLILELQEQYPEVTMFYNQVLVAALNEHWRMKQVLHQCTAMDRYKWFLENYPGLVERVKNKDIASFLGMSPESLSRLRKTIREQQATP